MGVIKKQGITNTVITYIGVMIGAINLIFVQPKLLSPQELGLTRLLYEFSYIIGLAVPLGLPNIIVKFFPFFKNAEKKHHGFGGFVLLIFFIGFVISASVLLIFKPSITDFYKEGSGLFVTYFNFVFPFMFIVSAITVTTAYCQSLFKSIVPSFLNDIFLRLGVIVVTILYFNRLISLDVYIYLFIGLYAIELIAIMAYILLIDKISFKPDKHLFRNYRPKAMLKFGLLLCLASFASIGIRKVDALILGSSSLGLVAIYTTAVFISSFIEVPLGALERISHTKIADNFAKANMIEIEKIYKDSVKYLLLIGGLLFIGVNACTGYVYELAGLSEVYQNCLDVVYIVSLGSLINISTGINSALIFYSKYYLLGTVLLVVTLAVTVVLNVFLIPVYGIYGAAIASAIGAFIYNGMKFLFIYWKFRFQPYTLSSVYIALLIVLCSLISFFLPEMTNSPFINLIIKGGLVSGIYILVIYKLNIAPDLFRMVSARFRKV